MRSELYHREQQQCAFHPYLIAKRRTEELLSERRTYEDAGEGDEVGQMSRFSELYEDAKKRQDRQAKLAEAILDN